MEKAETQFHAVFIENVAAQRFRMFFISRGFKNPGYTDDFAPPSFFKLLKFEDGIEYGDDGGSRMWEKLRKTAK